MTLETLQITIIYGVQTQLPHQSSSPEHENIRNLKKQLHLTLEIV